MEKYGMFSHRRVSERLYLVFEKYSERSLLTIGVIIGDNKAAVIDSGMGTTAELRPYIEEFITDKPLVCYSTHGHIDHFAGALQFDEYHLNSRDWEQIDWALSIQRRFGDSADFSGDNEELLAYIRKNYLRTENMECNVLDINDGDIIDLGGVQLQAVMLPGHSPGSMAYINRAEEYVFVGDALGISAMRWGNWPLTLKCLIKFKDMITDDYHFFSGHSDKAGTPEILDRLIPAVADIIEGRTDGDRERGPGMFRCQRPEDRAGRVMIHERDGVRIIYNGSMYGKYKI